MKSRYGLVGIRTNGRFVGGQCTARITRCLARAAEVMQRDRIGGRDPRRVLEKLACPAHGGAPQGANRRNIEGGDIVGKFLQAPLAGGFRFCDASLGK